jgi:hypothetical protein
MLSQRITQRILGDRHSAASRDVGNVQLRSQRKHWLSKQSCQLSHLPSGVFHDVLTLFPSSMRIPTMRVIAP